MLNNPIVTGLLVGLFLAFVGLFISFVRSVKSDIAKLRVDVKEVQTKVAPFWARVQQQMSADLHHPHPRYLEMDGLLEKLESLTITEDERLRLKQLLIERERDFHDDISTDQRKTASAMAIIMDMTVSEAKKQLQRK